MAATETHLATLFLILLWGTVALGWILRGAISSARSFWVSHRPAHRVFSILCLIALIAIGGRTPKEAPQSLPRVASLHEENVSLHQKSYALTEVHTNIVPSLELPSSGTPYSAWKMHGAHEDVFRLDSNTCVFSHGEFETDGLRFLPFYASLGIAPEGNWPKISAPNSLFWHDSTDYGSRRFTWLNALYERASDQPISFQAELFPSGNVVYRYDFGEILPTHYSIGIRSHENEALWQGPMNSRFLELRWTAYDPMSVDPDGDGLATLDEVRIFHTNPALADSDCDGLSDFVDELPTVPNGAPRERIEEGDGFCVSVSPTGSLTTPVALRIGTESITFPADAPTHVSQTISLPKGIENPVSVYAAENATVGFCVTMNSPSAIFHNPISVFSTSGALPGQQALSSGFMAQPVLSTVPHHLCYHSREGLSFSLLVAPELPGSWHWWTDETQWNGTHSEVSFPYSPTNGPTVFNATFLAEGALQPCTLQSPITTCAWLEELSRESAPDSEPCETFYGQPRLTQGTAENRLIPCNNDDDDASYSLDTQDHILQVDDDDLMGFYPLGRFDGTCCPCPEHRPMFGDTATLLFASPRISLYSDAQKREPFQGTLRAGECLYVEGCAPSTELAGERLVWESSAGLITHSFTVLSQRLVPDLDYDGDVDIADHALQSGSAQEHGWLMVGGIETEAVLNVYTDVLLPGVHTLSLEGDTFEIWESDSSNTNRVPLLTAGHTVTTAFDRVTTLFVSPPTNGTAVLRYEFHGEGISCKTSLRLRAVEVGLELWARDVDSGDTFECSTTLLTSHPVPRVTLEVDSAEIDDDGDLRVTLSGSFYDPLRDVSDDFGINRAELFYGDEMLSSFPTEYALSEGNPWQYSSTETAFEESVVLSEIQTGLHLFTLRTDENAAGERGKAYAYVMVGEELEPRTARQPESPVTLSFTQAPTTNVVDTAIATIGTNLVFLVEEASSNSVSDVRFRGDGFQFATQASRMEFHPSKMDDFTASVEWVNSANVTQAVVAVFTETLPTSRVFEATSFFDPDWKTHPVVLGTGVLEGTQPGFMEPFVANVILGGAEGTATNVLDSYGLSFRMRGEDLPLEILETGGERYLANYRSQRPAVFTALANHPFTLSYETWEAQRVSFELVTESGCIVHSFDAEIVDSSENESVQPFSRKGSRLRGHQESTSWTVEEAEAIFVLLSDTQEQAFHTFFVESIGQILKGPIESWGRKQYKLEECGLWDAGTPTILLNETIPNAVDAALTLFQAYDKMDSFLIREDIRLAFENEVSADVILTEDELRTYNQLRQTKLWKMRDVVAAFQAAMEMGVSFLPGDVDILIDLSYVKEDLDAGNYSQAAFTACLSAVGPIIKARKAWSAATFLFNGKQIRLTEAVLDTIQEASRLKKRPDRLALLRPLIQNGSLTDEMMDQLIDAGFFRQARNTRGFWNTFCHTSSISEG